MKINRKKIWNNEALISYFQIAILIISSFAFAYLVAPENETNKTDNNKEFVGLSVLLENAVNYFVNQIKKPIISIVSAEAETLTLYTCKESKNGEKCQEFLSSECDSKCKTPCFPGERENFAECKLGCCIDSTGKCMVNSPKYLCESGGKWIDSKDCSGNSECNLGCCVLGNNVRALVTEKECESYSAAAGFDSGDNMNWRAGMNEPECLVLALTQEKGACVIGNSCKFMTEQECYSLNGKFSKGNLCTNPDLNVSCEKTEKTTCLEGKDGVYFLDSCGNTANIYDSSKIDDEYWNRIYSLEESCNPSLNNADSPSCGNCNYFLGSKCKSAVDTKPSYGDFICKDMTCKNAPYVVDALGKVLKTQDRRNGESWCVYDGFIGEGKDVVGSKHFRFNCIDGEIKTEPCDDFRNSICVQSDIFEVNGTEIKFSNAACRVNNWQECIGNSADKEKLEDCNKSIDCQVKKINLGKSFKFDVCAPKYPEGFDLSSEGSGEAAKQICGIASRQCTVIYQQTFTGGCECIENCDCEKAVFTQQMNELCTSLGDCGGEANIVGEFTKNYKVKGAPGLAQNIISKYIGYAKPVEGQFAEVGDVTKYLQAAGILKSENLGEGSESGGSSGGSSGGLAGLGMGAAAIGYAIAVYSWSQAGLGLGMFSAAVSHGAYISGTVPMTGLGSTGVVPGGVLAGLGAFANSAMAAGIGFTIGSMIGSTLGLSGLGQILMGTGATLVAIYVGMHLFPTLPFLRPFFCLDPTTCIGIGIAIIIISLFFGGAECKPKTVTFTCQPWQAPTGGADCEKCNNELKPCSKYRCESLGQACKFMNEGTGNELCIASKNDGNPPVISPWKGALLEGYEYESIEGGFKVVDENSEDGCIESFTPIQFGISTDKVSQCKFDIVHTLNIDEMNEFFGDSNLYLYNHSMAMSLPSVESISEQFNVTTEYVREKYGNLKLYVRCQDDWGNGKDTTEYLINICVKPEVDITPPRIVLTEPANNAYIKFNETQQDVNIYTNEPANCKYDKIDKEYASMTSSMSCLTELQEQTIYGWKCSTNLGNLTSGENKIYIRCKDKPWLPEENETRFANKQGFEYILKRSESELKIVSLEPNGTVTGGNEPFPLDLRATTSGGAENGKATCYYQWAGNWITFYNTLSNVHTQPGLSLFRGTYEIPIKCEDAAGNTVQSSSNFILKLDTTGPKITRVYNKDGSLYISTNENSDCAYSFSNCRFKFENGTQMDGGFTQEHTTEWKPNIYYIKCRDAYGNQQSQTNNSCSIIVRPS